MAHTLIRFDCYEVDLAGRQIYRRGARLRVPDQCVRVLATLLERPGQAVTRDDLRQRLWPDDVFVDFDNALNSAIARLREVFGDSPDRPRLIETLPKRGYRFIAPVTVVDAPADSLQPRVARLLVLPFVNSSGDVGQDSLSAALTDEVITELARVAPDALGVIARTTAMRYKGARKDIARIAREVGVDYVLEGAARLAGGRVAVNVQLVRAGDQAHAWAKRYEGDSGDLPAIQASIAREVVRFLHLPAPSGRSESTPAALRNPIADPIAYNEYLQGRRYLDSIRTRDEFDKSRAHLESAVARDPGFRLAHDGLALLHWFQGYIGLMPPRDAFALGILHAVRAIQIDPHGAETHALLAQYHKAVDFNWPDIQRQMARALELDPGSPLVRTLYAVGWLMPQARTVEAIAELEQALESDPLSLYINTWLGVMLGLARRWDRAIEHARLMIEMDALSPFGPWILGFGCRGKGSCDEAIAAHRAAAVLSGDLPMMLGWLGLALGAGGRTGEAQAVLARLEARGEREYIPPTTFAWVHLGLRQVDRAFEWLDRAVDARDQFMMPVKSYAFLDPLRSDPRYLALLRKMRLDS
jgi:TolB-like protein